MSDYKVTDSELTGIANAIRTKGGTSSPLVFPNGFTSAIGAIPTGSGVVQPLSVTQNGTYTPPSGVDGYAPVVVNVGGGDDPFALTDYIESSGTQWIDTGYYVQDDSEFEAIANVDNYNSYPVVFGVRTSNERGEAVIFARFSGNTIKYNWDVSLSPSQPTLVVDGTKFYNKKTIFRLSKQKVLVEAGDGNICGITYSGGSITADYPLYLFSLDQGGADLSMCRCKMKLYRFRIRESGVLVHEFLPWIDGNNVVCLKDTVTGNLFYNAGTGVFTYGTDA